MQNFFATAIVSVGETRTIEGAGERHSGLAELLLRAHLSFDLPQQLVRLHVLKASLVRRLGHRPRQLRALRSCRRARRATSRATAGAGTLREHWLRLLRLKTVRAVENSIIAFHSRRFNT